jgi:hypothetical protein
MISSTADSRRGSEDDDVPTSSVRNELDIDPSSCRTEGSSGLKMDSSLEARCSLDIPFASSPRLATAIDPASWPSPSSASLIGLEGTGELRRDRLSPPTPSTSSSALSCSLSASSRGESSLLLLSESSRRASMRERDLSTVLGTAMRGRRRVPAVVRAELRRFWRSASRLSRS